MASDHLEQPARPPEPTSLASNTRLRIAVVLVIVGAIIGTAWAIGQREGFSDIGQGGINADLLPKVGEPAPELITLDTSGQLVRLSDFYGQPVWLNFWGSWCPPCRAEFPEVEQAYSELHPQGLVMLGVAVREDPLVAQDYVNRVGGTFPVLADPQYLAAIVPEDSLAEFEAMTAFYTIRNYPTHIFIDREGIVRSVIISPMSYEDAMQYGQEILNSPMPANLPATPEATPAQD